MRETFHAKHQKDFDAGYDAKMKEIEKMGYQLARDKFFGITLSRKNQLHLPPIILLMGNVTHYMTGKKNEIPTHRICKGTFGNFERLDRKSRDSI